MTICNLYRGGNDRLSGFVFNTETKTYKTFTIPGKTWTEEIIKDNTIFSVHKKEFKVPAELDYYFKIKSEMEFKLHRLQMLGFTEDNNIVLDFGVCVM